ncbi:MAG: PEGA domain-containing protein [Bradymonadales bacterium]|nr:PEGA domain-containing protein [Bradymonadales bacterium]
MKITSLTALGLVLFLSQQALAQRYSPVPEVFYCLPPGGPAPERAAVDRCAASFASVLTQTGRYQERSTPEVAEMVRECVQDGATPVFTQGCDLVSVQLEVDLVLVFSGELTRRGWLFDAVAMSPAQYAIVWRNHMLWEGETDGVLAALDACAELALAFLAIQAPDTLSGAVRWVTGSSATGIPDLARQSGTLQILDVTPSPVALTIDGAPSGTVPGLVDVEAGIHVITLRAPGCEDWSARIRIRPGEIKQIGEVILDQENAVLEILCNVEGAEINVDGETVGRTRQDRPVVLEISPASWDLRIHQPGYALFEHSLLLSPGGRQRIRAELVPLPPGAEPAPRPPPHIPILGLEISEEEDWITILPRRPQRQPAAMTMPEEEPGDSDIPFEFTPF